MICAQKLSVGEDPVSAFVLSAEAATAGAESTIQMQAQVSFNDSSLTADALLAEVAITEITVMCWMYIFFFI